MKKPEPIKVDNEVFAVIEMVKEVYGTKAIIKGPNMNLSPYEAEQLRDWLSSFLEWYYKE